MLMTRESSFTAGGTLRSDDPSYLVRCADTELLTRLAAGEFCYVLDTRQMGKSSLMVRTASRLRERGYRPVFLDLNAIGKDTTEEQWYAGLSFSMAQQIDREEEMELFWLRTSALGSLAKFVEGIRKVLLPALCESEMLVVFIDEIDVALSLEGFSTDGFFGAIRQLYNQRSIDPLFKRITFCLLGTAAPTELVRDPTHTPFNVGVGIQLEDFTVEEAQPYTEALRRTCEDPSAVLRRVLYWTGGHPFLTQTVCLELAESKSPVGVRMVDEVIRRRYLSGLATATDMNLSFAASRLLRQDLDVAASLNLYKQALLARDGIVFDKSDRYHINLRLTGLVRNSAGRLQTRNRIYAEVFNRRWIRANMPGAELRRQRVAFLKGAVPASAVALLLAGLAIEAVSLLHRAQSAAAQMAEMADRDAHLAYVADMQAMPAIWNTGNLALMSKILREVPIAYRSRFEWRYWLKQLDTMVFDAVPNGRSVTSVVFSPKGDWFAAAGKDGDINFWRTKDYMPFRHLRARGRYVMWLSLSHDGRYLAEASTGLPETAGGSVKVWDLKSGGCRELAHTAYQGFNSVQFSPDGSLLAAGDRAGDTYEWEVPSMRLRFKRTPTRLRAMQGWVIGLAFNPTGKELASGTQFGFIRFFDTTTGRDVRQAWLGPHEPLREAESVDCLAYSPDGKTLAAGSKDYEIRLWNLKSGQARTLEGSHSWVSSLTYVEGGSRLVSTGRDLSVRIWDCEHCHLVGSFPAGSKWVNSVAVNENQHLIATASDDGNVRLWDTRDASTSFPMPSDSLAFAGSVARGHHIYYPTMGGNVWRFDVDSSKFSQVPIGLNFGRGGISTIDVAADESSLYIGTVKGQIARFDLQNRAVVLDRAPPVPRRILAINCRLGIILSIDADHHLDEIDLSGRFVRTVSTKCDLAEIDHGGPIISDSGLVLWTQDHEFLTSGAISVLHKKLGGSGPVAISKSGHTAVALGWRDDLAMEFIDLDKPRSELLNVGMLMTAAMFLPGDQDLALACDDSTVKLFDVAAKRPVLSLPAEQLAQHPGCFHQSRDCLILVQDARIYVWHVASQDMVDAWAKRPELASR
jgi:WD40 repeat protein